MKSRDLNHVECIKNEDGRLIMQDENIFNKWMGYFFELLNETQASEANLK